MNYTYLHPAHNENSSKPRYLFSMASNGYALGHYVHRTIVSHAVPNIPFFTNFFKDRTERHVPDQHFKGT